MARVYAFIAALVIYAAFSAPTPDSVGLAEYLVMAGLMAAMAVAGALRAVGVRSDDMPAPMWLAPARSLLIFGLSVPLLTGLAQGHEVSLIVRDIVPFLFLLLPLFLPFSFLERVPLPTLFPYILCLMGLIFVGKVLFMSYMLMQMSTPLYPVVLDPDNLVNAPTVLFAAIFLTGVGGMILMRAKTPRESVIACLKALGCFLLTAVLITGMAWVSQRAHIGAWMAAVMFWLVLLAVMRPVMLVRLLPFIILAGFFIWPFVMPTFEGLVDKTNEVGLNNRVEEARAVWNSFEGNPLALMFGQGWGATIVSPAVGPDPVNYTHSLFTSALLKTGLAGLGLVTLYLGTIAAGLWRILWVNPVAALAVAAPFLIDITLYASFKSLDFGLLLVLIVLWTRSPPVCR